MLAIVPARYGSRGITRKNMQRLAGRPLIAHTVQAGLESGVFDHLVVTTDDPDVEAWAKRHGVATHRRTAGSATANATIAQVALEVATALGWEDPVAVLQPTSPSRTAASIRAAVGRFIREGADSLMSVARENHLYWLEEGADDQLRHRPLFTERVNRQFARSRVLRETGAIQIVSMSTLAGMSMVGAHHLLFELPDEEALDIDTVDDLAMARRHYDANRVLFRLTANTRVGSGHLHHCLQLATELVDMQPFFLLKDCDSFAYDAVRDRGWEPMQESDMRSQMIELKRRGVRLCVNDVLDTDERDLLMQREIGMLTVCIEDLGAGPKYGDLVVNALYRSREEHGAHVLTGARYAVLRNEFLDLPAPQVRRDPKRVLLTFGGTDPAGLARRLAGPLRDAVDDSVEIVVIQGPGAANVAGSAGVVVKTAPLSISDEMLETDIVLTSAGRTVFEAGAVGRPAVVVAQNAREATHSHLSLDSGVVFLGLAAVVDDHTVVGAVIRLLKDHVLRQELAERMRRSVDGRGGERIAAEIRRLMQGW